MTLYCLSLSLSRIAKRVVELGQLPPREILSMRNHPFSHNPHLSTRVHTIRSIPSQGSILSNALACELAWSYAIPRQGGSANPSCTTKRAHWYHTRPVCVRVTGLYSTRGILKLDSRSQGKRRRTEEKAHFHQNRVSYSIMRWVFIQTLAGAPWVNVGLFQVQISLVSV